MANEFNRRRTANSHFMLSRGVENDFKAEEPAHKSRGLFYEKVGGGAGFDVPGEGFWLRKIDVMHY